MKLLNGKISIVLISACFCLSAVGFAFASSRSGEFNRSFSSSSFAAKSFFDTKKRKKKASVRRNLIRGPKGGCYYINRNGRKTYVSRSACKG